MAHGDETSTIGLFRFSMPRAGCALFWNFLDWYNVCGFADCGDERWDWEGRGLDQWPKFLNSLGLVGKFDWTPAASSRARPTW